MTRVTQILGLSLVLLAASAFTAAAAQASSFETEGESYPAEISGALAEGSLSMSLNESESVVCKGLSLTASETENASQLSTTPSYSECAVGGNPATMTNEGCNYVIHSGAEIVKDEFAGTTDITCVKGKFIRIAWGPALNQCEMRIGAVDTQLNPINLGLANVEFFNQPKATPPDILAKMKIVKRIYDMTKVNLAVCPKETKGEHEGTDTDSITLRGSVGGTRISFQVEP